MLSDPNEASALCPNARRGPTEPEFEIKDWK